MKKIWMILVLLLVTSFVVALDGSGDWTDEESLGEIGDAIEEYSPLDEYGEVDLDKYRPVVSDAELKVDEVNLWLEENALWLKVVFGMVPSISWLFIINLWLLILAFIALTHFFGLMPIKKIDLIFFEASLGNILGIALFIVLLVTKVFVNLSVLLTGFIDVFWNYILPWGLVIAVIIAILVAIVFISLPVYASQISKEINKWIAKRKEKKAQDKQDVNRKELKATVEGLRAA